MVTRRTICRSREVRITKPAATAVRGEPSLTICFKIEEQIIRVWIEDLRTDRNANNRVSTFFAGSIAAFAVQTATGNVQRVVA